MKIAYVVESYPVLSETFVLNEVRELRRRGHTVSVFALSRPNSLPGHPGADEDARAAMYLNGRSPKMARLSWAGAQLTDPRARRLGRFADALGGRCRWLARYARPLGRLIRDRGVDRVHGHFAAPGAEWAALAAVYADVPYTFTAHRRDIFDNPPAAFGQLAAHAEAVVTVSAYNKRYIVDRFGVSESSVSVIPCGVDLNMFTPAGTGACQPPTGITVARLAPEKDHATLLRALAQLARWGVDFRWRIVGDGPERAVLESLAAELGLVSQVRFTGAADAVTVRDLLQQSTVFALSSVSESLGVVYIEAMACGLPIVGTDVLGVSEVVRDDETGRLVPPRSPQRLAEAIRSVLEDPSTAACMGEAGRRWVEARFTIERQVSDLLALWRGRNA